MSELKPLHAYVIMKCSCSQTHKREQARVIMAEDQGIRLMHSA